jgi:two-component system sensor histidine kinase ChvG
VTVDDDGPGIPESAREAIFERFHSDRPESEFGRHSGLGLAIARTIVEAHDGSIAAQDRGQGQQGASFIVTFPKMER